MNVTQIWQESGLKNLDENFSVDLMDWQFVTVLNAGFGSVLEAETMTGGALLGFFTFLFVFLPRFYSSLSPVK